MEHEDTIRYQFYATFKNPLDSEEYITILTPKDYDYMIDNSIYPSCSIKVVQHGKSKESLSSSHAIKAIKKSVISDFSESVAVESEFLTMSLTPLLLQDEAFYYQRLIEDGYRFFIQVDENYYPDGMLNGNYVFGFGCLYLYKHELSGEVIAGFWQYS